MFGFGVWEVILVVALIILFFGGRKIPELASGLGTAIRKFKGEMGKEEDAERGQPELPRERDRDGG